MDETKYYDYLREILERLIQSPLDFRKEVDGQTLALSSSFETCIKSLRKSLVTELEPENNNALSGVNTIPDETLRAYIKTTRDIRAFIFDNIDTHILTIEKLSDQILCRRRAYERSRKGTSTQIKNVSPDSKAVIQKEAAPDKTADLLKNLNSMSKEEQLKLMQLLSKK